MQRNWTSIGSDYNASDEQKHKLSTIFDQLEWQEIGKELILPAMPGLGIKTAIRELELPGVSHVALSHEMAPYGLYGIRAHYRDGRADIYLLDEGHGMVLLASDLYPNTVTIDCSPELLPK